MTAAQHLRQEGMQQGIQQGKREGMQQGKREGMYTKSIEIARHMLSNMQLDIKTVSQATGLSTKTLKRLSEKQPWPQHSILRQQGMHIKSIEIAKINMLASHESKARIRQYTGLSWVEIEALIREQKQDSQ